MEGEHTYLIKYCVYFGKDAHRTGTMKVKNCASEFHAKVKLEKYLSRKKTDFRRLVVYECTKDTFGLWEMFDHFRSR